MKENINNAKNTNLKFNKIQSLCETLHERHSLTAVLQEKCLLATDMVENARTNLMTSRAMYEETS